jgi:hypothetical protein
MVLKSSIWEVTSLPTCGGSLNDGATVIFVHQEAHLNIDIIDFSKTYL